MFNGLKRGIVICACAALAVSCMDYGPIEKEDFEIYNAGSGDEVTGKGLFITTAQFTREAVAYAEKQHTTKIVLVDGDLLAKLMIA